MKTKPEVFIIETLDPNDEGNGRCEGMVISHILRLHNKAPKYQYVRTSKQFRSALKQFKKSRYRYLHISAHGSPDAIYTTDNSEITHKQLGKYLKGGPKNRRLFFSSCSAVNSKMAGRLIEQGGVLSVFGFTEDTNFDTAAVFWPAFYHTLLTTRSEKFESKTIRKTARKLTSVFDLSAEYSVRQKNSKSIPATYTFGGQL